jgi:hypothetical protein
MCPLYCTVHLHVTVYFARCLFYLLLEIMISDANHSAVAVGRCRGRVAYRSIATIAGPTAKRPGYQRHFSATCCARRLPLWRFMRRQSGRGRRRWCARFETTPPDPDCYSTWKKPSSIGHQEACLGIKVLPGLEPAPKGSPVDMCGRTPIDNDRRRACGWLAEEAWPSR